MSEDLGIDVSRETFERLQAFEALVQKWTTHINLVSKGDREHIWSRHIVDSAQIVEVAPPFERWVDIGSGGGFPGIVVSIIAGETRPDAKVTMIESDQRKATFLRTAIRELDLDADVISDRIEQVPPIQADVLSARALADLSVLLGFAISHLREGGAALFLKGGNWRAEDERARSEWQYDCMPISSRTNPEAAILKIQGIQRV